MAKSKINQKGEELAKIPTVSPFFIPKSFKARLRQIILFLKSFVEIFLYYDKIS